MKKYTVLTILVATISSNQPVHAHQVDMDAVLKSAFNQVVIPATVGIACGIAGRRLPNANGVDQVATFVGTTGTIFNLVLGENYTSVLSSASFLAAYLIARTCNLPQQ